MEQKIITARSTESLNEKIDEKLKEGWIPVGSHQVVVTHEQLRFSGTQHKDTIIEREYSQTMVKPDPKWQDIELPNEYKPLLGALSDRELFGKDTTPKEKVLYKVEYKWGKETKTGYGHYVADTDDFYILCEGAGVGWESAKGVKIIESYFKM